MAARPLDALWEDFGFDVFTPYAAPLVDWFGQVRCDFWSSQPGVPSERDGSAVSCLKDAFQAFDQ